MIINNSTYGMFPNKTFTDIWDNSDDFIEEYKNSGLQVDDIPDKYLTQLFYLLYAEYGNSVIVNNDENQFRYRVFSIIYSHGPTWYKRVEVQAKFRGLTIEELQAGSKAIYNNALNDGSAPSTSTLEELPGINSQNTTNYKKSVAEAYALLLDLLKTDVTSEFIRRFDPLFNKLASAPCSRVYITEVQK